MIIVKRIFSTYIYVWVVGSLQPGFDGITLNCIVIPIADHSSSLRAIRIWSQSFLLMSRNTNNFSKVPPLLS